MPDPVPLQLRFYGDRRPPPGPAVATIFMELEGHREPPLPGETPLWRYISLGKFVSLLSRSALWFSRIDLLQDPFEGSTPPPNIVARLTAKPSRAEDYRRVWYALRRWILVNCWHIGPHESDAMWRLYAPSGEGVALRSTQQRLEKAIRDSYASRSEGLAPLPVVRLGPVQYIDHAKTELLESDPFARYFLKRYAFRHEAEYRAIAPLPELLREEGVLDSATPSVKGQYLPVTLRLLLEEIVMPPNVPSWYSEVVQSLVNRFGLNVPTRMSSLEDGAVF